MTGSSDSDDKHRAVQKNGTDRQQDRAIRDLRSDWLAWRDEDEATHRQIIATVAEIGGDIKAAGAVGRILWGLVFIFLSTLGGVLGWYAARIGDLEKRIEEVNRVSGEHEKEGMEIGRSLRRDVDNLAAEVREWRNHAQRHHKD